MFGQGSGRGGAGGWPQADGASRGVREDGGDGGWSDGGMGMGRKGGGANGIGPQGRWGVIGGVGEGVPSTMQTKLYKLNMITKIHHGRRCCTNCPF